MRHATSGETLHFRDFAVKAFEADLRGELIQPGGDGYDHARTIYNGMIDKHPRFIHGSRTAILRA